MPPKRRRRFQGLYYHSSPPKVLPMNGQIANSNGRRTRGPEDFSVKLSTIRIWMHEKDIGKLTRVLWAGQGNRLRQQASTNAKVKRFLAAVPYVMNSIKDVHQAVIDNSLENLQANLEPPVPPSLVTCRDANGLNLIHKAAGLGHATILEYLITTWPDGVHETDITGKTPLHWAASAKNNMRCYTLLTQAGCDEEAVDYKMKTPSFYRHKPHEIERAFLTYVPEAPRVSPDVATDWEALSDDSGDGKKLDIKIPEMNGFGRHSNAESNENTSEAEMTEAASGQEDEDLVEEPSAEVDQIVEAPQDQEEVEHEPEHVEENEEEEKEEEEKEEELQENQSDENFKENEEANEAETDEELETEDMQNDKKEPPDEKQTITEANANLTKESTEKDKIETKNVESQDLDKTVSDLVNEDEPKDDLTEQQKLDQSSTALEEEQNAPHINADDKAKDSEEEQLTDQLQEIAKYLETQKNEEDNEKDLNKDIMNETKDDDLMMEHAKEETEKSKNDVEEIEQNPIEKDLKISEDQDNGNDENVKELKQNEEEMIETKDQDDEKTLGETLSDIKDEFKDNIKYLADQVKNVFSDKDTNDDSINEEIDKKDKKDFKDDEHNSKEDDKTEAKHELTTHKGEDEEELTEENLKESQENNEIVNSEIIKNEEEENRKTKENEIEQQENQNKTEMQSKENENQNSQQAQTDTHENQKTSDKKSIKDSEIVKQENELENEKLEQPITADGSSAEQMEAAQNPTQMDSNISATSHPLNNSSNENFPFNTQTPHPAALKSPTKVSPQKENEKTEEDENNNKNINNKLTNNLLTTNDDTTSLTDTINNESVPELTNQTPKDLENSDENFLNKTNMGEKLQEMGDNLKENITEMADKLEQAFSDKAATAEVDKESNDVVLHTESPQQPNSSKRSFKEGESSDDTNDEDEEQNLEPESEENNETEAAEITTKESEEQLEDEQKLEPQLADTNANAEEMASSVNNNQENERDGAGSTTSSLAIEGFVQGAAEDNTVQSQTAAYVDDDEETRLRLIIDSGDMEQLAQIVLNGDGKKLLNVEADEPEIQAFLKNVPNYMGKIHRVHEAARSGSLLNLQQALDRRKFAIAKDEISPHGATPLHVAVLFGNSDIVRYLSARFPETTTITDNEGRTALHYAAVINDNGHFYNVLLQLGANPKVVDNLGHTPEDYLSREELTEVLRYGELLKRFGAEELEEQLLSDQGRIETQSIEENPLFKTEQGKYLADNLADPLIKALTQVAQKRPNDPLQYLANYLQSYATSRNTNGRTITQAAIHSGSSQTNSTALALSGKRTSAALHMNGHADHIENDALRQIEALDIQDDGNDSDAAISKKLEERDEYGQSMLHFACARSQRKGALIHLIEDAKADITYRDEMYRTARDVALQANKANNAKEIDRYVMSLAIVGDIKPFEHFALSGYDHILDVVDNNETPIIEVVEARGLHELAAYLKTIRPLEELREELHQMIRDNNVGRVKEIADGPNGKWLIKAKNYYGRTALHIAILKESVEIVEHFVNLYPEALKVGDNLERTPLHYAMGTNIIESISRVLIQNGAKRTSKDLKGRQPSYYFMNKADILRLQEEEDESR